MKVLVTGFPGTGKSTIAQILKHRGYAAYDPQAMRGYMHLEDRATGRHTHMPKEPLRGWFDMYGAYNWDIGRVSGLIAAHNPVFICSLADNMESLLPLFDHVFVLLLDDFELEQRLRNRGKFIDSNPAMLADTLTLHRHFEKSLINLGAIPLNVHADPSNIVDRVLQYCRELSS